MKDIFGEINWSPELELFEILPELEGYDAALALYKSYRNDNVPETEALRLAAAEVIPPGWSSFSVDQL